MASGRIVTLVLKIAELCNLNCSYCYMYQHEDKTYLRRPKFMSDAIFEQLLKRVREYCDRRAPHAINLVFHGGEPTLIGPSWIDRAAGRAREVLGDRLAGLILQTNGILLDRSWVEVLQRHAIRPSISLDGPAEIHDAVRVDHAGRGSLTGTINGLQLLQEHGLNPGIICVINPAASGLSAYRYFRSLKISRMNFLQPDVSHDNRVRLYSHYGPTPIADYLIPVFDDWFREDDPLIKITIFWELIAMLRGGPPRTDGFGNPLMDYLIIETDGSIHANDALRVCAEDIAQSCLNLFQHGFDDLYLGLPLVHQLVHEGIPLSTTCMMCPERSVCGGGHIPHRYARANGFDNPSVWCADNLKLIAHIRKKLGNTSNA